MKWFKLLPIFGILLTVAAFGDSANNAGENRNTLTTSHSTDECPLMNGTYTRVGSVGVRKTLKTEKTSSGLNWYDDYENKSAIDGVIHLAEHYYYRGSCQRNSIVFESYSLKSIRLLQQTAYSWNDLGQLIVETNTYYDEPCSSEGECFPPYEKTIWELRSGK